MAELKFPVKVKVDITRIEELIDKLKHLQTYKMYEGADQTLVDLDDVVKIFADHVGTEAAKSEQKKGKWIRKSPTAWSWTCSCCKKDNTYAYSAGKYFEPDVLQDLFCPNCGADMRTEVQDDSFSNDDITFCSYEKCTMKKCERHVSQIRDKSIPHSFANFEDCAWWHGKV